VINYVNPADDPSRPKNWRAAQCAAGAGEAPV